MCECKKLGEKRRRKWQICEDQISLKNKISMRRKEDHTRADEVEQKETRLRKAIEVVSLEILCC
jgi:hypothetical protein